MLIVGLETFPSRITRFPATSRSVDLVVSASFPMSPLSPGAVPFHSSIVFNGSAARAEMDSNDPALTNSTIANRDERMREANRFPRMRSRHFVARSRSIEKGRRLTHTAQTLNAYHALLPER